MNPADASTTICWTRLPNLDCEHKQLAAVLAHVHLYLTSVCTPQPEVAGSCIAEFLPCILLLLPVSKMINAHVGEPTLMQKLWACSCHADCSVQQLGFGTGSLCSEQGRDCRYHLGASCRKLWIHRSQQGLLAGRPLCFTFFRRMVCLCMLRLTSCGYVSPNGKRGDRHSC